MAGNSTSQFEADDNKQKCANCNGLSDGRWSEDLTSGAEKTIYRLPSSIPSETKKTRHCSKKCNCYLTQTLMQLKTKIVENSRTLDEIAASNDEVRCNVKLTPSEEKLFSVGTVKDDSMVCCVLVRELRAQKRDLEAMLEQWVEFVDKADRFRHLVTEIREKLSELTPRIESIFRETKVLEEIELENEEARRWKIDEELRRSEERRESFREAVDRCAEAEVHDHLAQSARQGKLDDLDRDKFMDRGALRPTLRRMIKAMAAEDTQASTKKNETPPETSVLYHSSENNGTMTLRTAVQCEKGDAVADAPPGLCSVEVPLPDQSDNHDKPSRDKRIPSQESDQNRPVVFCMRAKARRPF